MNPIAIIMRLTGLSKVASTLAMITAIAALIAVGKCTYDAGIIAKHDAKITTETLKTDAVAKEAAATERAADTAAITKAKEERDNEIRKAPDSKPSAARNALNCDRMRRQGKDPASFPECR